MFNAFALTLDIDWAPDFVIDFVAGRLIERGVKATWFVTHQSPAIERLGEYPELFELGIHPNFLPGSSHGDSPEAVLEQCMNLVPDAVSLRTHGLVQSTALLEAIMLQTPIKIDVSLFLPHATRLTPVEYHWLGRQLLRLPYFWEDDFEMGRPSPVWRHQAMLNTGNGLKIFDLHPIHIYLNSAAIQAYHALKSTVSSLIDSTADDIAPFVQKSEPGTQTMFDGLLQHVSQTQKALRIAEMADLWRESLPDGIR